MTPPYLDKGDDMGALGLLLAAVGAILYWGVSADASGVDLDFIGVVLMVVGAIGVILSVFRGTFLNIRREQVVTDTHVRDTHVADDHRHH